MRAVRDLVEWPVSFRYGYNMKCERCGGVTPLAASTYYREERHSARVKCAHCPADIHFGPYAMALRSPLDPVLDDQVALSTAWYHTTTDPSWPSRGQALTPGAAANLSQWAEDDAGFERAREHWENQALHLGTYEAAIESMLRKMRDQDMGGERFWLYRVALRRDVAIEPGYRDETSEEIAQITQSDLGGSEVIRYLNTWESPGSVSLAVHRRSLAAAQAVPLPVQEPGAVAIPPTLTQKVDRVRSRIGQMQQARQDKPDRLETLRQRRAEQQGIILEREPTAEQHRLLEEISKLITCGYLPGVSLTVREHFSDAMSAWGEAQDPPPGDIQFMQRFAAMAAALTRPGDIRLALDAETVRPL